MIKKKLHLQKHIRITTYGTEELDNVVLITKQTVPADQSVFVTYTVTRDVQQAVYYGLHLKHHPLNKAEQVYIVNGGGDTGTLYSIHLIPQQVDNQSDICKDSAQYESLREAVNKAFPRPHNLPETVFDSKQIAHKQWVMYKVKTISHKSDVMKMTDEHYVLLTFKTSQARDRFLKLKGKLIADDTTLFGSKRKIHDVELLAADETTNDLSISYAVEDAIVRSSSKSSNEVISGANYYLPFVVFSTADTTKPMTDSEVLSVVKRAKFRINEKDAPTCRVVHIDLPTHAHDAATSQSLTITKDTLEIQVDWQEGEYSCVFDTNTAEPTDERVNLQKGMLLTSINGNSTLGQDSESIQKTLRNTPRGPKNPMILTWQDPQKKATKQYHKGTGISMYRLDFQAMNRDVDSKEALITFEPNYGLVDVNRIASRIQRGGKNRQPTRKLRRVPLRARRSSRTMKQTPRQRGGGIAKSVKQGINKMVFPLASLRKGILNTVGDGLRKFVPIVSGRKRFSLYYDATETNSYYVIIQKRGYGANSTHHIAVVHERFMVKADFKAMLEKMKNAQEKLNQTEKSRSGTLNTILRTSLEKFKTNKKNIDTSYHFLEVNLTKGYEKSTHGIGYITPISLQGNVVPHFEQALQFQRESLTHKKPRIVSMERMVTGLNTFQGEDVEFSLPGLKPDFGRITNYKHRLNESVIRTAIEKRQIDKNAYKHINMTFLSGHVYKNILMVLCKEWQRVFSIGRNRVFVNGFWPSMLLYCMTMLLLHEVLLFAGVETISPAIESLASVAGEDITVQGTGLTKPMFMENVASFFTEEVAGFFSKAGAAMYGTFGNNPYYASAAGGAVVGALGVGQYAYNKRNVARERNDLEMADANMMQEERDMDAELHSVQLAHGVAQMIAHEDDQKEMKTLDARNSLNDAVKELVDENGGPSSFGDLSQLMTTMGQLTSSDGDGNTLEDMTNAIQSLTKNGNFDPNNLSSLLSNKQSTEHLRKLCDVLLQLHDSATPAKQQLIRDFRESLIDKSERISHLRNVINEKQARIAEFESDIQSRRDQIDVFTQDKNKPIATPEMIESFNTLINSSKDANVAAQTKIDNLSSEIAELQHDIDDMNSDGVDEKPLAEIPTESSSQAPTEEDIRAVEAANAQANQEPSD